MTYEENAIVINETIFDLINSLFDLEKKTLNPDLRNNFFNENQEFFVKTDDGSYSIKSKEINHKIETLHTSSGAISESFEKFIKPLKLDDKEDIAILDICAGLGYNSTAAISKFKDKKSLKIDMVEISKATLACGILVKSPISEHEIIKKAIENQLIKENYASLELVNTEIPENIEIKIFIEDARKTVQKLEKNSYDAIFLDPFSQNMAPELFSLELFKEFMRVIKDDGLIATYTSSAPVRSGFIEAGFHIGKGPVFGRKQGGTLASPSVNVLDYSLPKNDEIRIALSDVGIPFRDPGLNNNSNIILENRTNERKIARGTTKISSAVKTPIFLGCKMEDEKLKRRVERNLNKMNIPSTTSKEAYYLVDNNYEELQNENNNSRSRILDMCKKLKEIKKQSVKINHIETALNLFKSKFHCSQAVFAAFSEEFGLSKKQALKIGSCFGSGMRKGEVCGACVGALMVLGLKYGHFEIGDLQSKLKTNQICEDFLDEFKLQNGSYLCNDLLKCDISTEEGVKFALDNNLFTEFCPKMVKSAVEITEILLND